MTRPATNPNGASDVATFNHNGKSRNPAANKPYTTTTASRPAPKTTTAALNTSKRAPPMPPSLNPQHTPTTRTPHREVDAPPRRRGTLSLTRPGHA